MEREVVALFAVDFVFSVGGADECQDQAIDAEGGFDYVRDEFLLRFFIKVVED